MARKKWIINSVDKQAAKELADECNIDPLVALIMLSRGCCDPVDVDVFFSDYLCFSDPFDLPDMEKAVDRIKRAIDNNERIAVCGDYDADGVTASSIVYTYLERLGCYVMCSIPERLEEGYGLHNETIDMLHDNGIQLIITVDNGISANAEIEYAKSLGIDTVITDHHLSAEKIPDAVAVVDPHLPESICDFKDYAGVGVAFMLICALENLPCEDLLDEYGDLVALGTVADMVPLKSENRLLVKRGIEVLNERNRIGVDELLKAISFGDKTVDSGNIAFGIAPRINAAGRMGKSFRAFKLLTSADREEAAELASEISTENVQRQKTESEISHTAISAILNNKSYFSRVIVVSGNHWHNGVLGIVAARICECFGKPAIVISVDGDIAKGSARSIDDFDIFAAISACSDLLVKQGGHKLAAGLTIKPENIPEFTRRINEFAGTLNTNSVPKLKLDCRLNPVGATLSTYEALRCLSPFGCENPEPLFCLSDMTVYAIHAVGNNLRTLRITLRRNDVLIACIKFNTSIKEFPYKVGDNVDAAVSLKSNTFKGNTSLTVIIKVLRPVGINDETYFSERAIYEKFMRGETLSEDERNIITPTRDDMAEIFRYLKKQGGHNFSAEILCMRIGYKVSFGKLLICLEIMTEFSLITKYFDGTNTIIEMPQTFSKKNFDSSRILKKLRGVE